MGRSVYTITWSILLFSYAKGYSLVCLSCYAQKTPITVPYTCNVRFVDHYSCHRESVTVIQTSFTASSSGICDSMNKHVVDGLYAINITCPLNKVIDYSSTGQESMQIYVLGHSETTLQCFMLCTGGVPTHKLEPVLYLVGSDLGLLLTLTIDAYTMILSQGSLAETLKEVQPTFFFGVPRYPYSLHF